MITTVNLPSPNTGASRHQRKAKRAFQEAFAAHRRKDFHEAIEKYTIAIKAFPTDSYPSLANRGMCYYNICRPDLGLRDYEQAIRVADTQEKRDMIRCNRGVILQNLKRLDEAMADFQSDPSRESQVNISYIHLMRGNYEEGLKFYRHRNTAVDWPDSVTDIEKLRGKDIIIVHEQGYGDSIQMCRFAAMLAAACRTVKWATRTALVPLLRSNLPGVEIIDCGEHVARALVLKSEAYVLVMDLWECCGLKIEGKPYLKADASLRADMNRHLPPRPRIALSWRGRVDYVNDHNRSASLKEFLPAIPGARSANAGGVNFISLQKDLKQEECAYGLFDAGALISNFADSAAVLANCDAVMTVDTGPAHLAGALGIPTALCLPFCNDWRWGLTGDRTPWYDSIRLFRQPKFTQWGPPVKEATEWLATLVR